MAARVTGGPVGVAKGVVKRATAPVGSVVGVRTSAPEVVLTYDDGPHPEHTPAVLSALAERGASATFFVLLGRVRRSPGVLRDIVAAGHEVALHGTDHVALTALPPAMVEGRLRDGKAELEDAAGAEVRWLRPPYGKQTWATWNATRRAGLVPVMWGPTLADSRPLTDDERIASVLGKVRAGAVVLCHDAFADVSDGADDGPAPEVDRGALASRLLGALAERDLRAVSLATALRGGRLERRAWFGR